MSRFCVPPYSQRGISITLTALFFYLVPIDIKKMFPVSSIRLYSQKANMNINTSMQRKISEAGMQYQILKTKKGNVTDSVRNETLIASNIS